MFNTKLARLMAAVACAALLTPSPALAAQREKGLPKPPVVAHPDIAPSVPGNIQGTSLKMSASLGSVIPGATGTNSVTFGSFKDGDILVVLDPAGLTGHAGMFDDRYYDSIYSYAMWSANTSPVNGVQREQCVKYRANNEAFGLRVSGGTYYRASARNFAARQLGKPYNILGAKTDLSSFYCSKVAWTSWRYTLGVDLDADGGYWVWPVDLINSRYTILFGYWG
jgi:hypothetical protein